MKEVVLSKKILVGIGTVLVLVTVGLGYIVYSEQQKVQSANPQNEVQNLISALSKITDLPQEQPTIATVTDKEKLKQYPFFTKSEIGDKVLIFNQAKKAYLYRPSTGKLIEIGPIQLSDQTASASGQINEASNSASASATQKSLTLALLNGTKTSGLAAKTESQLKDSVQNIQVKTKGNAKQDYTQTVVVALNSDANGKASELAKTLNAKVETKLPEGESKPTTDLVVFLGADRI